MHTWFFIKAGIGMFLTFKASFDTSLLVLTYSRIHTVATQTDRIIAQISDADSVSDVSFYYNRHSFNNILQSAASETR